MTTPDTRALETVTSTATPFRPMVGAMADHAAARHVDRWAPERDATARSASLRNVAFVDRLIAPWFGASQRMARLHAPAESREHGHASEVGTAASWVFPRPWYQDELDWLAAGRTGQAGARPVLTTRGTYVAPRATSGSGAAADIAAVAGPMDLVAPWLSGGAQPSSVAAPAFRPGMPAGFAAAPSLSAWSPIVPFAAAQAAQLVAGTIERATRAGFGAAERSPILEALAYVSPAELAGATRAGRFVGGSAVRRAGEPGGLASTAVQTQLAAAVARIDAVASAEPRISSRAAEAPTLVTPPAPIAPDTRGAPARAAPGPAAPVAARSQPAAAPPPPVVAAQPSVAAPSVVAAQPSAAAPSDAASTSVAPPVVASGELPADVAAIVQLVSESRDAAAALRAVDLLTRAAASGSAASLAPASGPRVAMPAGLGGLAAAVDAARVVERPLAMAVAAPSPALPALAAGLEVAHRAGEPVAAPGDRPAARTGAAFAPVWTAPPSALAAVAADRPAAIDHVAWTDRWLARFAGASSPSLDTFAPSSERAVPRALAAGAPEVVFVAPMFARPGQTGAERASGEARMTRGEAARPSPSAAAPPVRPAAYRIDDAEAVPDEVFAAIARARSAPVRRDVEAALPPEVAPSSPTVADLVVSTPPSAPSAGLGASLASSPLAPALASLLPLPQAPTFDPRALYGAGLAAAYSAGLLAPALAQLTRAGHRPSSLAAADVDAGAVIGGVDAGPDAALVASSALAALAPVAEYVAPAASGVSGAEGARQGDVAHRSVAAASAARPLAAAAPAQLEPVAVRSSLLAPATSAVGQFGEAPLVEPPRGAWTPSPGMTAESAHAMAVRHERSAGDLAFDFVAPELVLAARVYGFGPVEAAQAARLAVAGAGGLAAMATAVDLTFLRAIQDRGEDRRQDRGHVRGQEPGPAYARDRAALEASAARREVAGPSTRSPEATPLAFVEPVTAYPAHATDAAPPSPGERAELFGVARRLPRGAFLWPAGAVAALGLEAAASDPAHLPLAALELLAASAVADLGTWVAARGLDEPGRAAGDVAARARGGAAADRAQTSGAAAGRPGGAASPSPAAPRPEPSDAEVTAFESAHRARFEAVYLALSQSPDGMSMSPSARVARALAVMARSDDSVRGSALERAAAAWSALPVVIAGEAPGAPRDAVLPAEGRPGLARLSAQAGEFLGSFVSPSAREIAAAVRGGMASMAPGATYVQVGGSVPSESAASSESTTGRGAGRSKIPFARHGGGEVEIPPWFEAAARSMFEGGSGGASDGISLADLTLIASVPATQVAAKEMAPGRTAGTSTPSNAAGQGQGQGERPDIEALALEVYTQVLKLIDVARERNGEPFV